MYEVSVGDPVEVMFLKAEPPLTLEQLSNDDPFIGRIKAKKVWIPATVTATRDHYIEVAFSDSQRMAVANGNWRPYNK